MASHLTKGSNGVSYGAKHTVTATDASDGYVEIDFQVGVDLVASIQVVNPSNVVKDISTAVVTYPSAGKVRIADGTSPVTLNESIGTGDASTKTFTKILSETYVDNTLVNVVVGGAVIDLSVTDAEPEVITGTGIDTGSSLTRATNTLVIVFDDAPATGVDIVAKYNASATSYITTETDIVYTVAQYVKDTTS